jgi:hypothetical protein
VATALSEVLGHEVTHVRPEVDDYRAMAGDEMTEMYGWFEQVGYGSNPMADAEAYGIDPNDFASFLSNTDGFQSLPPAA